MSRSRPGPGDQKHSHEFPWVDCVVCSTIAFEPRADSYRLPIHSHARPPSSKYFDYVLVTLEREFKVINIINKKLTKLLDGFRWVDYLSVIPPAECGLHIMTTRPTVCSKAIVRRSQERG